MPRALFLKLKPLLPASLPGIRVRTVFAVGGILLVSMASPWVCEGKQYNSKASEWKYLDSPERLWCMPRKPIIDQLGIRPGMEILDLGAGIGYFTFALADALGGKGTVYATDVVEEHVQQLKVLAKLRDYGNVLPVLVSTSAKDTFYRDHSFDIIFVSEVISHIGNREEFFGQLHRCLKPGGRLFIIDAEVKALFYEGNIKNYLALLKEIAPEGKGFPVYARLDAELQEYIEKKNLAKAARGSGQNKELPDDDTPEAYKRKLIESFNRILSDRSFFGDIDRYYLAMRKNNKADSCVMRLEWEPDISWFEYQLSESGVFDKKDDQLTDLERNSIAMFNYILLNKMFDSVKTDYLIGPGHIPSRRGTIREMRKAGYTFVRSHDVLPLHFILEFSR